MLKWDGKNGICLWEIATYTCTQHLFTHKKITEYKWKFLSKRGWGKNIMTFWHLWVKFFFIFIYGSQFFLQTLITSALIFSRKSRKILNLLNELFSSFFFTQNPHSRWLSTLKISSSIMINHISNLNPPSHSLKTYTNKMKKKKKLSDNKWIFMI